MEPRPHDADPLELPVAGVVERQIREELTAALARAVARPDEIPLPAPLPGRSRRAATGSGRPISFNAAMARALVAGHKSQTRRPIRPVPVGTVELRGRPWPAGEAGEPLGCRLAGVGDRLWVREPWRPGRGRGALRVEYEADVGPAAAGREAWRPGRFLPREASRLTLEVLRVVPARLAELTPQDAAAEGLAPAQVEADPEAALAWFRRLWDGVYGKTEFAWSGNPWIWVVEFKVLTAEESRWWRPG